MTRSRELIDKLIGIHREIDAQTGALAASAGLGCPSGCGKCCDTFDIEVTVLDCLPLADHLIRTGSAEKVLAVLETIGPLNRCPLYVATGAGQGSCGAYSERPILCRLFGHATLRNKTGDLRLASCDTLKLHLLESTRQAEPPSEALQHAPVMEDQGRRLAVLDPVLGSRHLPIGLAIKKAIERLMLEQSYNQEPPAEAPGTATST